ncbi:MAG: thymidine phosphorylase [Verrucomicrobiota bacterium]
MFIPQEIIAQKRDGDELSAEAIQFFVDGLVDGSFEDYQASALLMAIFLNGMSPVETAKLTEAMMRSGRTVELPEIQRPKVDKHSTGGVGDKVSLILAPLAAACGLCVPMMSGRGLGHTGGTLDKLESIPGFSVMLSDVAYRAQLASIHQAMIGQSRDIVPADRILYALRDVTGTVESIPLICASILSKKMAEGIDALVLDVKCGRGAFMKTEAEGRELASHLIRISEAMGKRTSAIITRMDEPLGYAVGNSLEVIESIVCLKGEGPEDLMKVTFELCAEMLRLGGLVESASEGRAMIEEAIRSGRALAAFKELILAQGGDAGVIEDARLLPQAEIMHPVAYEASEAAYLVDLDAYEVGQVASFLGAGRTRADAAIDPAVGLRLRKKVGDRVRPGEVLCEMHLNDPSLLNAALQRLKASFTFSSENTPQPDIVIDKLLGK